MKKLASISQMPLLNEMAAPLTPAREKLLDAAVEIRQHPDAAELAFMAGRLVQMHLAS